MTLETLMETAQQRGLKAITVWKNDAGYQASVSFDRVSWTVAVNADLTTAVVEALRAALRALGEPVAQRAPEKDLFA